MYVRFRCKGFCFLCNCPLNVYIKSNNYEVRELIRKYRNIRPIWLYNNETYYKFSVGNLLVYVFRVSNV